MNEYWIRQLFPNASRSTIEANAEVPHPEPEPDQKTALDKAVPRKKEGMGRVKVSYCGFYVRLQDPENFAASTKDCTDGLRRCGLIYDDDPENIELRTTQKKVRTYAEERLEIQIEYP